MRKKSLRLLSRQKDMNPVVREDGLFFGGTVDLWYPIHVYESGQAVKICQLCPFFILTVVSSYEVEAVVSFF